MFSFKLFNGPAKLISLTPEEIKVEKIMKKSFKPTKSQLESVVVTSQDLKDQADWWVTLEKWNKRILHLSSDFIDVKQISRKSRKSRRNLRSRRTVRSRRPKTI